MDRTVKTILFAAAFAASAFAQQNDTAYVPVVVTNTNALVKIDPTVRAEGYKGDEKQLTQGQQQVFILVSPAGGFTSVTHGAKGTANVRASASYGRGAVTLNLAPQAFENAQVSLFTVSGKRVLRGKTAVSQTSAQNISRRNIAPGLYILSVKGTNGNTFTHKFSHGGGRLDIKTTWGAGGAGSLAKQAQALAGGWTLTASADGFRTKTYTINPKKGNNDEETITLYAEGDEFGQSALEYFESEGIKLGWNLGNTLDAVCRNENNTACAGNLHKAVEGAWGTPAATHNLIKGLPAQGVDIVRIGVSYNGHISGQNHTIDAQRLNRVKEVVDWVIGEGMKAIINIHHDGNYTDPPNTWGFLKFAEVMRGTANNDQVVDQIEKVWTQIAEKFKTYGPELIFETFNEVHTGNWGGRNSDTDPPSNGAWTFNDEQDRFFEWNTAALNAIRATGGNNAKRYVAVPALGSTEPQYVTDAHSRNKLLPDDGENGTRHLIVSIHSYHPWRFTVAGVVATQGNTLIHTISDQELREINTRAANIHSTFISKGIAAYYGEWGAPTWVRAQDATKDKNGNIIDNMTPEIRTRHVNYIGHVAAAAAQNGIIPIIWDDGGDFRLLNRSNGNVLTDHGLYLEVWNAYKEAAGGSGGPITPTDPVPPANIQGNLGNYQFGTVDGTIPNYEQALWMLSPENVTRAKASGAKLVLTLSKAPTAAAQLIWQGPDNTPDPIWWQDDNDILGSNGTPVSGKGVTWNAGNNTLTIVLSDALKDYSAFATQSSLNLIVAYYYDGGNINDLGITKAELTQ